MTIYKPSSLTRWHGSDFRNAPADQATNRLALGRHHRWAPGVAGSDVEGMYALTKTTNLDPEALLYDAFGTLSIVGKILTTPTELAYLEAHPVHAAIVIAAAQAAIPNFELGLTETPGEARSLHGAFHVFEAHFAEQLTQAIASFGAPSAVESLNSIPRAADTSVGPELEWGVSHK